MKKPKSLVFIDTNILLDFYRQIGQKESLTLLKLIDANHDRIITGNQVEMEFKKNRQLVIHTELSKIKLNKSKLVSVPGFLSEKKESAGILKSDKEIKDRCKKLETVVTRMLTQPNRYDEIYKACQRLFRSKTSINLTRENPVRRRIRFLAKKRFMMGYPPRKNKDISIGDAINWEWIVDCAAREKCDVIIAARDSDYGVGSTSTIINDWLNEEFKDRVGRLRQIKLSNKLTDAMQSAGIHVSKTQNKIEDDFLNMEMNEREVSSISDESLSLMNLSPKTPISFTFGGQSVLFRGSKITMTVRDKDGKIKSSK